MKLFFLIVISFISLSVKSQSWKLTPENIERAIKDSEAKNDTLRPSFHLTPPAGCMGDPNGGIYHNGWYHMYYGLQPFAHHPGAWYWAHAKSKDLLYWEHIKPGLTPAFELDLNAIGSGSTIVTDKGEKLAFYSQGRQGPMEFWKAEFTDDHLSNWDHKEKKPVLTLDEEGLPPFDDFWRDPFVFSNNGRYFLIACADRFDEDYVPVPIFEASNKELTEWDYKGNLFTVPKHKYRNLEVPEFRKINDKWIFMASTDAPIDRVNYFIGEFDIENLKFNIETEGIVDFSGHFYAQEMIQDDNGDIFLMGWIPGWDRDWLPYYQNEPLKNSDLVWNGCFSLPRKIELDNGNLIQQPVETLKKLRGTSYNLGELDLPVTGPMTAIKPIKEFSGDQLELKLELELKNAAFCGITVLANKEGIGGLSITWSGNILNVDGVRVPIEGWEKSKTLELHVFVDHKIVEVFVNEGRYCISRQVEEENIKGKHVALTSLGGTARLLSLQAWELGSINP